jgi:ribosomal protein L11 methyltransferase
MNYLSFLFETNTPDQSEQLVALLSDQGFEGFEETGLYLKAFIPETDFSETSFRAIEELFPSLVYTKTIVENINWNKQWEESFEPVLINDFVAIRAGFHQPITQVQHEIIITPKMSFGTGHHATTHLMIQQMQLLDFTGKTVLDFGTGTGILAILAEKLGAAKVLAIDNDEWSITNAKENIQQNGCHKISIEQHHSIPLTEKYDIILANINLNVITDNISAIEFVSNTPGNIIFSGFLKEDETAIKATIKAAGLQSISTLQRGEWIAILAFK